MMLFFEGAGFIPARIPARMVLWAGISPAPTVIVELSMDIRIFQLKNDIFYSYFWDMMLFVIGYRF